MNKPFTEKTPKAPPVSSSPRRSVARIVYLVHTIAGLWFTAVLSLVMVSGTVAVFGPELDRLAHPELRAAPPEYGAKKINPGVLYDAVAAAYPGMGIAYLDTAAHDRYAAATTTVILPGNEKRTVSIDPYSGNVRGEVPSLTPRGFIVRLHAVLFQGLYGFYVVNFCGVLLLIAIITGLVVDGKFWRRFFKKPRFGRGARILLGDLHRQVAVWSLGCIVVIGVTGTWYFYNFPLAHLGLVPSMTEAYPSHSGLSPANLDALGPGTPERLSGAKIVEAVLVAHPDLIVTGLMPPMSLNQPFIVYGDRGEYLCGRNPNAIYVNPFTGEIMKALLSEDLRLGQYLFQTMSQLHHGELLPPGWGHAAKVVMKVLWFLGGVGGSFLCLSGLLIYARRSRRMAAGGWRRIGRWLKPWGGPMGPFKYVNVLIILGVIAGIVRPPLSGSGIVGASVEFVSQPAGSFDVALTVRVDSRDIDATPLRPGASVRVFPRLADGRFPDARAIHIGVVSAGGVKSRGVPAKGAEHIAFAPVRLPEILEGAQLWVEITAWDGRVYQTQWPLLVGGNAFGAGFPL